ncbi:hypothetical protein Ga0609869_002204 [Rhodovulum iodosum]|uniref:Uncharacterized protein n=1 Tax=Rhodovulum iodosum TaxID=68291 RepID=A0ABV3XU41_9RHOB|nr:hypothetical protein [Rhodovulum robiginosum]RSK32279.1 hypothetical protein EJA01_13800 [Rhodovulum robiginosum]
MAALEELADALAKEALEAAGRLDDERLVDEMSRAIGEISPTTQEAFMTAVRFRRALQRGRTVMGRKLEQASAQPGQAEQES